MLLPVGSVMNAAYTRAVASKVISERDDREVLDAPPLSNHHRTCMYLEDFWKSVYSGNSISAQSRF